MPIGSSAVALTLIMSLFLISSGILDIISIIQSSMVPNGGITHYPRQVLRYERPNNNMDIRKSEFDCQCNIYKISIRHVMVVQIVNPILKIMDNAIKNFASRKTASKSPCLLLFYRKVFEC
jgi:hypothetical protein